MTEDIRKAVIRGISEKFGIPVYGKSVPQGGKLPCFTVELQEMKQKRLLGNRAVRMITFVIHYYCDAEKSAEESLGHAPVRDLADPRLSGGTVPDDVHHRAYHHAQI